MKKGSLVLVDLTARVKDTGEVIETTMEEDAKKLGVYDESRKYAPKLVSVGEGWVLKGVDEALVSAELGKRIKIDVPPEKAFGLRDPEKVRRIPLRKFGEKAGELSVGDEVEIDNRTGLLRFIGSGRAQIDFNHRYAGKVLVYDLLPIKDLKASNERIIALIRRRLPIDAEKISLEMRGDEAIVRLPENTYLAEGIQIIKRAASTDIFKYIPNIVKLSFIETYESSAPKKAVSRTAKVPKKVSKKAVTKTPAKKKIARPAKPQPKNEKIRKGTRTSS